MIEKIKKRILEISYQRKLSHIGSCLTSAPIILEIMEKKNQNEPFILSNGHAALGLYCVNEALYGIDAQEAWEAHGTNPDHCKEHNLDCSTGSLGNGIGIALG